MLNLRTKSEPPSFPDVSIHDLLKKYKALNAELAICGDSIPQDSETDNTNDIKEKKLLDRQATLLSTALECSLSKPDSILALLELWWREEINGVAQEDIKFSQRLIEKIYHYYRENA